jgi:hypothetical protein
MRNRQLSLGEHPGEWFYPNGVKPNIINPIFGETARPEGAVFRGPSGRQKTDVDPTTGYPGTKEYGTGFRSDTTGAPWVSGQGNPQGGGPIGVESIGNPAAFEGSVAGGDRRNTAEKIIDTYGLLTPSNLAERWADNPVSTLFFGLAFIWIANQVLFRDDDNNIANTTQSIGRTAAAPGQIATRTGKTATKTAIDATNEVATKAIDTVEDVVDTATGGSADK